MFAKGKISEEINCLKVTNFNWSKSKILKHTFNLNFSAKTKCFYDFNYVRKDLMCELNHLSDVLPLNKFRRDSISINCTRVQLNNKRNWFECFWLASFVVFFNCMCIKFSEMKASLLSLVIENWYFTYRYNFCKFMHKCVWHEFY